MPGPRAKEDGGVESVPGKLATRADAGVTKRALAEGDENNHMSSKDTTECLYDCMLQQK